MEVFIILQTYFSYCFCDYQDKPIIIISKMISPRFCVNHI